MQFTTGTSGFNIVCDNNNILYLADIINGNPTNKINQIVSGVVSQFVPLDNALILTIDSAKQNLYVFTSDSSLCRINIATQTITTLLTNLNINNPPPGVISCCFINNNIYYTDGSDTNIIVNQISPSYPYPVSLYATLTGVSTSGMTVDTIGNIYISSIILNNAIIKIAPGGSPINYNFITGFPTNSIPISVNYGSLDNLWVDLLNTDTGITTFNIYSLSGSIKYNPYFTVTTYNLPLIGNGFDNNNNFYFSTIDNSQIIYVSASPVLCFKEGSKILCLINGQAQYVSVEDIRKGTLVKTSKCGYKPVAMIGSSKQYNPGNTLNSMERLYICREKAYPELKEDLIITGGHSILVDELTETQKERTIEFAGRILITDQKYRLMACLDSRAEPYTEEGMHTLWHFALDHDDLYMNYGVYANGLLVETASKRMMSELSGMNLL